MVTGAERGIAGELVAARVCIARKKVWKVLGSGACGERRVSNNNE